MAQEKRHVITHLMLERLIGIHKKIKSECYPNTKQLAQEFNDGKGVATISRDIEFLRDRFGAPIQYDFQRRGFYYTEDYDMPLNSITPEKLIPLFLAKQLLIHYKDTPLYKQVSNVIDFLNDSTSCNNELLNRISVPPMPTVLIEENTWNAIINALQNNTVLEFDYCGRWNKEVSHRKVHPYQLILDNDNYFLYGFSQERNANRLFALTRIKNIVQTSQVFTLPPDFEFESHCGGGKFGSFSSQECEHYKIEFYQSARQIVKDCIWADDQILYDDENRDCTTIEFNSTQFLKIEEWILSQGCFAKPLEPEWLVNDWNGHILGMAKLANLSI